MPKPLSSQDRLALAFTSYGSLRAMARDMGITHQKLGRWLREGQTREDEETGEEIRMGVKAIPQTEAAQRAIDQVYRKHAEHSKAAARADGLPFDPTTPAFFERRYLDRPDATGKPVKGDRVFVEHTQFIKPELRRTVIEGAARSKQFMHVSVRSVIDLSIYNDKADDRFKKKRTGRSEGQKASRNAFKDAQRSGNRQGTVATQYQSIGNGRDFNSPDDVASGIEKRIREKHEAATGIPGTILAASYLFQLIPAKDRPRNESSERKPRRASTSQKRHIRGRGNK